MCFSPEASFGISAVLATAGVYCIKSAYAKNQAFLCLAVIPMVFSVQQFAEGFVWIGLRQENAALTRQASLVFLAFALAFWPFWVPLCGFFVEADPQKKRLLGGFAFLGLTVGLSLFLQLILNQEALVTRSMHHSVYYDMHRSPAFQWMPLAVWELLYVALVAVPPIITRTGGFFLFSVAIVLSAAISHLFFWYAEASVWCFFAAVLSLYLCFCLRGMPFLEPSANSLRSLSL